MVTNKVTDAELAQAKQRWETEHPERPIPASVRFHVASERVILDFTNKAAASRANGAKGGRPKKAGDAH